MESPAKYTHADIFAAIGELRSEIGNLSSDVTELRSDVSGLVALKNQGIGAFAAITLTGALLLIGLKTWLMGMLGR